MRGSFQTVQRGVAPSTEGSAAGLAAKGLDRFSAAIFAIANERMNVYVCNAEVGALVVGAGEAMRLYALGSSSPAFHLAPGTHKQRRRLSTR